MLIHQCDTFNVLVLLLPLNFSSLGHIGNWNFDKCSSSSLSFCSNVICSNGDSWTHVSFHIKQGNQAAKIYEWIRLTFSKFSVQFLIASITTYHLSIVITFLQPQNYRNLINFVSKQTIFSSPCFGSPLTVDPQPLV